MHALAPYVDAYCTSCHFRSSTFTRLWCRVSLIYTMIHDMYICTCMYCNAKSCSTTTVCASTMHWYTVTYGNILLC